MGTVQLRDDFSLSIVEIGTIRIRMFDGWVRTLEVKHVPDMKNNLISLSLLDKKGYKYSGQDGVLNISKGALTIIKGKLSDDLYCLVGNTVIETVSVVSSNHPEDDVTHLWHMRLGHMSERWIRKLSKRSLLCGQKSEKLDFCEQHIVKFNTTTHRTKSAVLIEKQTKKMIESFRTNKGLEFCKGEFGLFYKNEKIVRHCTVDKTPYQNEIINTACYLVNRSPSTAIEFKTPKEVWSDKPADYSILRVFGCLVHAHVSDGKLELRETECIFLGYAYEVKGYQLWCTDCKFPKFMVSRDVTFDKSALLYGIKSRIANTSDQEVGKQVELEINALVTVWDDSEIQKELQ
ncbi:Uncharacterized protein TCM_037378 [Theobroma cacao]|uniref:Uncharacterized protein n=1 Tax=Theobroma cacao TaxID=3641 RepID=A0A061GSC0_THECC|nr:Uncharacterized protein TCM_037378 [Theobroma cacao]